jgi:pimeloyl-ACP methyl ester carboxylesterase
MLQFRGRFSQFGGQMQHQLADTGQYRSATGLWFTDAGVGPAVLLVHGLISDHRTWSAEIDRLSGRHRVIAPDLLGHGDSGGSLDSPDVPPGDFSLGAHAAALRDLLDELGIGRVTVVGHSLGGGIAMQLAYLFPDRVEALVLVSSGGLGRDLGPGLRAATLPGSELVLPVLGSDWVRWCGNTAFSLMGRIGLPLVTPSAEAAWAGMASFADGQRRRAFLATARAVVDARGQLVSAIPKLTAMADLPVLVVWGGRDRLIPPAHANAVSSVLPKATIEVFPRAGHFPHLDDPERFHRILSEFLRSVDATRGNQAPRRAATRAAARRSPRRMA